MKDGRGWWTSQCQQHICICRTIEAIHELSQSIFYFEHIERKGQFEQQFSVGVRFVFSEVDEYIII
jgi:predicted DNA-binding transcriptional regulator AlpA